MKYINIRSVQAVRERLLEQVFILKTAIENIRETEQKLQGMSLMDETRYLLDQSRRELEDEVQGHQSMAECLASICAVCKKSEENIVQMYDLEQIIYPDTDYGVSDLTDLDDFADIILF